uniref:Sushi domain-containing protein n=1 Tax=Ascaris lumbricoides TaxID=6252 RepID=A0A0M3HM99_ASCLU
MKQGDVLACDNGIPLGYEPCYFSAAQDYGTKTSRVYCYSSEPGKFPFQMNEELHCFRRLFTEVCRVSI